MTDQRAPDAGEIWQQEARGPPKSARAAAQGARRAGPGMRRRRGRSWLAVAGYAALGLVWLGLAAMAFLVVAAPVDILRDRLIEQVRDRTGRELVIAGNTSVSLFPRVTVSLSEVSLAGPGDMPGEPTLTVPSLEVEVGYWSLVTGRAVARRATLRRPTIALSVDAEGRRSWEIARAAPAPRDEARDRRPLPGGDEPRTTRQSNRIGIDRIQIVDGTLRYRNARSGAQHEVSALALDALADGPSGGVRIEGSADWRGERVGFSGTASPVSAFFSGQPAQLAIRLSGAPFEAVYEGTLAVAGAVALEGSIGLKAPSARALRAWLGQRPAAEADPGALAASARLTVAERKATVSGIEAVVGGTSVRGALAIEMKEARAHVGGNLAISDLDVGALLVRSARSARPPEASAPPTGPASPAARPAAARDWGDDPIDRSLLRLADADIAVSVESLAYKDIKTGPSRLSVAVAGGFAKIALEEVQLYGGRARGLLTLDATGEVLVAGTNLRLTGVSVQPLLSDALGFNWLDGRGNLALALAGQGVSERQIVETLNGKVELAVANGAITGIDVGKTVRSIAQGRLSNLTPAPADRTPFSEFSGTFEVVNGIATNKDLRLAGTHLQLSGEGSFDLGARQMNCEVRAKVSGGQPGERAALNVGTLEVPVTISGPWDRPAFGIKGQEQLVETVKQLGKRLKSRDVQETIKGLMHGDGEERTKSREKARELLERFLKKE